MRFGFFEVEDWEKDYIKQKLKMHQLVFVNAPLTSKNVSKVSDCDGISVFIYSEVDKEIIDKLPKLKFIATMSTGYDHIDVAACKAKGIMVSNVPTYGENTVAEHTFALILALSRNVVDAVDRTRKGDFTLDGLRGFDLKGKTIGVVGTGHIGMHVIRMAKGFEMDVIAFDVKKDLKAAKKIGFKYVSMDSLLKNSKIITLHCPYNKATHHLINNKNVGKIMKGAVLINTSRGGLVETHALIKGLSNGNISAAGLDVIEEECNIKEEKQLLSKGFAKECDLKTMLENHMLINQRNVIVTPHNAFNSREALVRILKTTMENLNGFAKKKSVNLVK
jgi:D-lactate dehydrogenase